MLVLAKQPADGLYASLLITSVIMMMMMMIDVIIRRSLSLAQG